MRDSMDGKPLMQEMWLEKGIAGLSAMDSAVTDTSLTSTSSFRKNNIQNFVPMCDIIFTCMYMSTYKV